MRVLVDYFSLYYWCVVTTLRYVWGFIINQWLKAYWWLICLPRHDVASRSVRVVWTIVWESIVVKIWIVRYRCSACNFSIIITIWYFICRICVGQFSKVVRNLENLFSSSCLLRNLFVFIHISRYNPSNLIICVTNNWIHSLLVWVCIILLFHLKIWL